MQENKERDAVLLEKINNINEKLGKIEGHLEKMNGRLGSAEAAIQKQTVINGILSALGLISLGIGLKKIFGGG